MAELEKDCCSSDLQATCCEPSEKSECCGERHGEGCGCSAGTVAEEASLDIREAEAGRVLRPGGRFAVSDVIADDELDAAIIRADKAH